MSGIVGILNLDGAPVDRALLERMTTFMTFRGPDAQAVWVEGAIGFGHTMLRTTWEAAYEHQPFTLDQQVWIVADARIDDRETLAQKLEIGPLPTYPFGPDTTVITDIELILRAYLKWSEDCVHHLLGDFAFTIWDERRQRLFCARDQFGIKPFYYSQVGRCFLFSNTLNCLRQHPQVSATLNEAAIGDFLLFGFNFNLETTTFVDIQRLPPAHALRWTPQGFTTYQYWTLPLPPLCRYRTQQDYIDHFKTLIGQAVDDRLRQEKISIFLSGGLDSNTIAATVLDVMHRKRQHIDLQAVTGVYDRIIPDEEQHFSDLAASALGIPVHYLVGDNYQLYEGWAHSDSITAEPYHDPLMKFNVDQFRKAAEHSRVGLYGQGGDETLKQATVSELLRIAPWQEVLADLYCCLWTHKLWPPVGSGIYDRIHQWRGHSPETSTYPTWLNPSFAQRLHLSERWHQVLSVWQLERNPITQERSRSAQCLTNPLWSVVFEECDPAFHRTPIEVRLPFLDLRLLEYLLSVPPLPWCVGKQLLRLAMQDTLPGAVCQRPKTPLAGDPVTVKFAKNQQVCQDLALEPCIEPYVDGQFFTQSQQPHTVTETWVQLRPLTLMYWLKRH